MPPPVSAMLIRTVSSWAAVRIVIVPRSPESPITSPIACAALTMRFSTTWLMSPRLQTTVGSSPSSHATSATYLYSLVATMRVFSITAFRSTGERSAVGGWPNSRIARTIVATRCTPSTVRWNAAGTRSVRYSMSASISASPTRWSSSGAGVPCSTLCFSSS